MLPWTGRTMDYEMDYSPDWTIENTGANQTLEGREETDERAGDRLYRGSFPWRTELPSEDTADPTREKK